MGQYTRTIKLEDDSLELEVTYTYAYKRKYASTDTPEAVVQLAGPVMDAIKAALLTELKEVVEATNSQLVGPDD